MGIEIAIGIALAAAAASAVGGIVTAQAQARSAKKSARARKEATEIQTAQQRIQDRESRRQAVREERIRRAQILQGAESSGVSQSSGALGAVGALSTSRGRATGFQRTQERAAMGIGRANQRAIDADLKGQLAGARGALFQNIVGGFASIFG